MAGEREVVVLSGVRTAVGKYGGSLKDKPPIELAAAVVREAVDRSGVQPADVDHVVFGNVIHTETRDMYLSRVAAVNAGLPVEILLFDLPADPREQTNVASAHPELCATLRRLLNAWIKHEDGHYAELLTAATRRRP